MSVDLVIGFIIFQENESCWKLHTMSSRECRCQFFRELQIGPLNMKFGISGLLCHNRHVDHLKNWHTFFIAILVFLTSKNPGIRDSKARKQTCNFPKSPSSSHQPYFKLNGKSWNFTESWRVDPQFSIWETFCWQIRVQQASKSRSNNFRYLLGKILVFANRPLQPESQFSNKLCTILKKLFCHKWKSVFGGLKGVETSSWFFCGLLWYISGPMQKTSWNRSRVNRSNIDFRKWRFNDKWPQHPY